LNQDGQFIENDARPSEFSVLLFYVQVFIGPLLIGICTFVAVLLAQVFLQGWVNDDVTAYGASILEGFSLGYLVRSQSPRAMRSGGAWIWALPACLLISGCIYDMLVLPGELPKLFYGSNRVWGIFFGTVTLPTIACCFYTVGMVVESRRSRSKVLRDLR
jgi:hypothetical protein